MIFYDRGGKKPDAEIFHNETLKSLEKWGSRSI